ncbi:hypothetical protein Taro_007488, partial [Colocasia esculenta]|nr:hypothetical protein [Colocasia esculenta]
MRRRARPRHRRGRRGGSRHNCSFSPFLSSATGDPALPVGREGWRGRDRWGWGICLCAARRCHIFTSRRCCLSAACCLQASSLFRRHLVLLLAEPPFLGPQQLCFHRAVLRTQAGRPGYGGVAGGVIVRTMLLDNELAEDRLEKQNGATSSIKPQKITYIIPGIKDLDHTEIIDFVQKAHDLLDPSILECAWIELLQKNKLVTTEELAEIVYGCWEPLESYCAHLLLSKDEVYFTVKESKGFSSVYQPRPIALIILLLGYGLDSPPKKLFLLTFMKPTGSHPLEQSHEQ